MTNATGGHGAVANPFQGGQIYIQLANNQISFVAGQVIQGIVHVNLMTSFDGTGVTIGLFGNENVYFRKRHKRGKSHYYRDHFGDHEIIDLIFPIQNFIDGALPPGQYSFPFALQIPDWLPASMAL